MSNTNIKKYFVLTCIFLIIALMVDITSSLGAEPTNPSGTYMHTIFISGNKKLDAFVSGNGTTGLTLDSAHVIKDFIIHSSPGDFGIFIQDIDRYLILRNCSVFASETEPSEKTGIEIRLSSHVIIENCSISYYKIGIMFLDTQSSTITGSISRNNLEAGIHLLEADSNVVDNNIIINNLGFGIFLKRSNENTISNNFIDQNADLGIYDKGNNNVFINNSVEPTTTRPIFSKTWLWVILGVGGVVFFIGGLMFFITWRGR